MCIFIILGTVYGLSYIFRTRLFARWRYGMVEITEAALLPSDVTHLVLRRPNNFKYKAGDYVYICIPSIARDEWHPFSISSAPEVEGTL